MSFAFNIPFAVERGETMETIKATEYLHTAGDVYNWLISLGYTPKTPKFFVRKSPYGRDKNNVYNPSPLVIFPNLNGQNYWGFVGNGAKNFGTAASVAQYIQPSSSAIAYINPGDEYYVMGVEYLD